MGLITAAIDYVKGLFKTDEPVADIRPDAEDAAAYTALAAVEAVQKDEARTYPLQLLRYSSGLKPSNEKDGWEKVAAPPAGYDSWVDVYDGPQGVGYVTWYEIKKGKDLYRKAINVGPETWREQDWTAVETPMVG